MQQYMYIHTHTHTRTHTHTYTHIAMHKSKARVAIAAVSLVTDACMLKLGHITIATCSTPHRYTYSSFELVQANSPGGKGKVLQGDWAYLTDDGVSGLRL